MATGSFKLERFQAGQPLLDQLTATRLNAILDAIDRSRIQFGANVTGQFSNSGTTINANPPATAGGPELETPFLVITQVNDGTPQLGVISNSHLFNGEDKDVYEEDNSGWGLLSDDRTSGWFDVPSVGDKIWLEIALSSVDQSITSIDIRHGPVVVDNWDEYPNPIAINTDDNPYQNFYNQIIAEVTDPTQDPRPGFTIQMGTDDTRKIVQLLFTNLNMATAHTVPGVDGLSIPLLVPIPWCEPGTNVDGSGDEVNAAAMTPYAYGTVDQTRFTFQMFDASDSDGYKALILDGVVYGPFDDGNTPSGMGGDDFIIGMNDGDDVYLIIPVDDTHAVVPPITIATGPATPGDTDSTLYVTIGNLSVDPSGTVIVENTLCGDYTIPRTLDVIDEDEVVTQEVDSIQFTTDGSDSLDVTVEQDAPGEVTVHLDLTPDSTLQNLVNAIDNAPNNSIIMKDAFGNLTAVPVEDCSKC